MSPDDELQSIREQKRKELLEGEQDMTTDEETGTTPDTPIKIDGQDHFEEVVEKYDVVLVDIYADWCGPCQMMEPTIETLAAESDVAVVKVDVDAHQMLAQQLGVQGVPTLVVYGDGEPVKRVVGAQDRQSLEQLIGQAR